MTALVGFAIIGGFGEASVLVLVVMLAAAVAGSSGFSAMSIGPLGEVEMDPLALAGVAVGVVLGTLVAQSLNAYLTAQVATNSLVALRREVFHQFLAASWSVQSQEKMGHLQEIMGIYTQRSAGAILLAGSAITAGFNFLSLMASALFLNWQASAAVLVLVGLLSLAFRPLAGRTRQLSGAQATTSAEYARSVTTTSGLALEIKTFGVQEQIEAHIESRSGLVAALFMRSRLLMKATPVLYRNLAMLVIVFGLAAAHVLKLPELASLGAIALLMVRALSYTQSLQSTTQQLNDLVPYAQKLRAQVRVYAGAKEPRGSAALGALNRIQLRDVGFTYDRGSDVLRDVSFDVQHGESLGIIGPSGSGKSTLLQLLLLLRRPSSGAYLVNGRRAEEYAAADWYRRIAFLPQESHLVAGTIAENIRFFRGDIPDVDIERASRDTSIHDDVVAWPEGYDTQVGEGGAELSGGQKQRLALARTLAGRPDVIILDEPTSALDMRSEQLVHGTLQRLRGEVTLIIVAHRMSTIRLCDKILVLREGHVDAFGSPEHVAAASSFFEEALRLG